MDKRVRRYTIIISILLHFIIFFVAEKTIDFSLLGTGNIPESIDEPIVFDLSNDKQPKQIIETTEEQKSQEKAEKPDYFSDKNSIARNKENRNDLKTGSPFSKGDIDSPTLPEISDIGKPIKDSIKQDKNIKEEAVKKNNPELISESVEDVKKINRKEIKPGRDYRNQILRKNILSKVKKYGGFAFNTYDWNFAPYLLELKRKIQSNIFPPLAFSKLGMISGESLLKFRIQPDGRLTDLVLLDSKGHKSLTDTSIKAVDISAPFPKLPDDFPEPYLEVTGKFIYFVRR